MTAHTGEKAIRKCSDFSDRFGITAGRAIRKVFDPNRSEKRSETDQTDQKNQITAGRAIRKSANVSDRLAIRKPHTPLGVWGLTPREEKQMQAGLIKWRGNTVA